MVAMVRLKHNSAVRLEIRCFGGFSLPEAGRQLTARQATVSDRTIQIRSTDASMLGR